MWRQIVEEKVNNKKIYTAVNFVEVKKIKDKPAKEKKTNIEPPTPILGTNISVMEPEPVPTTSALDHKEPNGKTLDDEVKLLMEKYDPTDIVLSVLTKMQVKMNAQAEMIRTLV